jgi:CHAD domain-containing protein
MRPEQPMTEALRLGLEAHAGKLKKRLRKAARGDVDGVHDARTTLRRLREGLLILGRTGCDPYRAAELERGLHDVEQALGATRDDDVLAADLEAWLRKSPRATRAELAPLHALIQRRRRRDARSLSRELERGRTKKHIRNARRFLRGQGDIGAASRPKRAKAEPTLVRHFVPAETWRAYEHVLAYETRLVADLDVIHKVRSSCRRLRYALELFAGALPRGAQGIVDALRTLQERLGELHDHAVAVDRLKRWVQRGKVRASPSLDAYIAERTLRRDRLRREFESEWRALTGNDFRFALSHAVSGETGKAGREVRLTAGSRGAPGP